MIKTELNVYFENPPDHIKVKTVLQFQDQQVGFLTLMDKNTVVTHSNNILNNRT